MNPQNKFYMFYKKKYNKLLRKFNKTKKSFKKKNKPINYKDNVITYGSGRTVRYFEYDFNSNSNLMKIPLKNVLNANYDFKLMCQIYSYAKIEAIIITIPPSTTAGQIFSNIYWDDVSSLTEEDFKKSDSTRITTLHSFRYRWRYFRPLNSILNYEGKAYNLRTYIKTSDLFDGEAVTLPGNLAIIGAGGDLRLALKISFRNANYHNFASEIKQAIENAKTKNLKVTKVEQITFGAVKKDKKMLKEVKEMITQAGSGLINTEYEDKRIQTDKSITLTLVPQELEVMGSDRNMSEFIFRYMKFVELFTSQIDATSDYLLFDKEKMDGAKSAEFFHFIYKDKTNKNWIDHLASTQAKLCIHLLGTKYEKDVLEQSRSMLMYIKTLKLIRVRIPKYKDEDKYDDDDDDN